MSFTVKNRNSDDINRYCLWQSNGQPLKNAQNVDMYPYDHMHLSLDAHKNLAQYLANAIPDMI